MAAVAFEHLDKVYANGVHALRDLTLSIDDGELLVMVGPSGCGKSTLLRLLAGLEAPSGGVIRIGERVVNDCSPQERNVAMVFQDYALYPFMSVRGNLEFPLAMRRLARAEVERRVAWAAAVLDLGAVLDRLPRELSGGQRQRVAMGRALVREPSVSLLDEPLSNLDAKLRVEVRAEIADLQARTHTTMLYVTHDQTEAMTLGQRIAVLDQGVLQQVAPPQALYDRPANVFVASFIGNPPMNVLPVSAARRGDGGVDLRLATQTVRMSGASLPDGDIGSMGIRPEGLALADDTGDAIRGTVGHVELLGHETLVHLALEGIEPRLIARLAGMHTFEHGSTVRLRIDPAQLHFFAPDGRALECGAPPR